MHRRSFLGARLSVAGVRLPGMDLKGSPGASAGGAADWSGFLPTGTGAPAASAAGPDSGDACSVSATPEATAPTASPVPTGPTAPTASPGPAAGVAFGVAAGS